MSGSKVFLQKVSPHGGDSDFQKQFYQKPATGVCAPFAPAAILDRCTGRRIAGAPVRADENALMLAVPFFMLALTVSPILLALPLLLIGMLLLGLLIIG